MVTLALALHLYIAAMTSRTIDTLISLRLEFLDTDLYRSVRLFVPPGARGVYGGQLVANAIEAASQTVDLDRMTPHSIHSSFLRAGSSKHHVYFHVRRIRNGRSFATRTVTAQQDGSPLFFAVINFHCDESSSDGVNHAPEFPVVPPPESGTTLDRLFSEVSQDNPSQRFKSNLKLIMNEERVPMELRYVYASEVRTIQGSPVEDLRRMPRYCWMRSTIDFSQTTTRTPSEVGGRHIDGKPQIELTELTPARAHMLIACWCSDFFLAIAGLVPHGFPNPRVQMLLSLDHTIYFHNSHRRSCSSITGDASVQRAVMGFPVDDWFLYEVVSPFAANNRALNIGRIFSRNTGKLEMTIVQESLVRMKPRL
jgi:acyl-CoA thioesterase II